MCVWLCGLAAPVATALANWSDVAVAVAVAVAPAGLFIFGVTLVVLGFFPEAVKAERIIRECVSAAQQRDEADEARDG
jgi:hypothetical protein